MKGHIYKLGNRIITTGEANLSEIRHCMGDLLEMDEVEFTDFGTVNFTKVRVV